MANLHRREVSLPFKQPPLPTSLLGAPTVFVGHDSYKEIEEKKIQPQKVFTGCKVML